MSLLEKLELVVADIESGRYTDMRIIRFLRDHGQALLEAVEDAARYRHLRSEHVETWFDAKTHEPTTCSIDFEGQGHDIDAALDLWITKSGET
jgi:hypothetical protein